MTCQSNTKIEHASLNIHCLVMALAVAFILANINSSFWVVREPPHNSIWSRKCKSFIKSFITKQNKIFAMNIGTQFVCGTVQSLHLCWLFFFSSRNVSYLMCYFRYWIFLNILLHTFHVIKAVCLFTIISSIDIFT